MRLVMEESFIATHDSVAVRVRAGDFGVPKQDMASRWVIT